MSRNEIRKILIMILIVINAVIIFFVATKDGIALTKVDKVEVMFKKEVSGFVGVNIFIKDLKAAEKYKGLANLTIKMLDKGTEKSDKYELANRLEEMGAKVSYSIYDDFGLIAAIVVKENVGQLFQYLSEVLHSPDFNQTEIDRLRKKVIVDIEARKESPAAYGILLNRKHLFGEHYYGYDTLGETNDIKQITRQDMALFHHSFNLNRENTLIVINGDYNKRGILKHLRQLIAEYPKVALRVENKSVELAKREDIMINKGYQTDLILYNLVSPKITDKDFAKWLLVKVYLSDGLNSPLFELFREEQGIGYAVGSIYEAKKEAGLLYFYVQTMVDDHGKVVDIIEQTLSENIKPAKEDFLAAKAYFRGNYLKETQSLSDKGRILGKYYLYSGKKNFSLLKNVQKVNYKDFLAVLDSLRVNKINTFVLK